MSSVRLYEDELWLTCSPYRTSTFDGLSIAYAVLHQLAGHLGCIGFFATHFTSLVEDFAHHPEIALKHLQTFVNDETREVTFLYKLTDGSVETVLPAQKTGFADIWFS